MRHSGFAWGYMPGMGPRLDSHRGLFHFIGILRREVRSIRTNTEHSCSLNKEVHVR